MADCYPLEVPLPKPPMSDAKPDAMIDALNDMTPDGTTGRPRPMSDAPFQLVAPYEPAAL